VKSLEPLEPFRLKTGPWKTKPGEDFGFFFIPIKTHKAPLKVMVAPADQEWQHVSVSLPDRCPAWEEMNKVKELFWEDDECVMQFHPPKIDYISNCRYCLHLWKWTGGEFPRPPRHLVGIKERLVNLHERIG